MFKLNVNRLILITIIKIPSGAQFAQAPRPTEIFGMPSRQMLVKTVNGLAGHLFASYAHWHYEEREQESDGASSEALTLSKEGQGEN